VTASSGPGQAIAPSAIPVRWSIRYVAVWVALLSLWELLVRTRVLTGLFMPPPSTIAMALGGMVTSGTLATHVSYTAIRITAGLLIGATAGVTLGLGMGMSRRLRRLLDPIVAALHPIPRLAFFPLLIVMLGVGESSKLAAVAIGAFFPMLLNTVAGVRSMNPVHLELARNFGATRRQMFRRVLLPGSLPLMLTGLRLSANVAFHGTIGVEMVGSQTGIGSLLWLSWQTFRIDNLYAILVVIATIGIGLAAFIRWITVRTAPWMAERQAAA
jgi:ABC-type nitrate/sulfonate/bicarbonate transport system permease component